MNHLFYISQFFKESAINLKNGLLEKTARLNSLSQQIKGLPDGDDTKFNKLYYYLLQASLFSEIGISTNELLEYLDISRPTLQKGCKLLTIITCLLLKRVRIINHIV